MLPSSTFLDCGNNIHTERKNLGFEPGPPRCEETVLTATPAYFCSHHLSCIRLLLACQHHDLCAFSWIQKHQSRVCGSAALLHTRCAACEARAEAARALGPPRPRPGRAPAPVRSLMVLLRSISTALTAAVAALGSALFIALSFLYTRRVWSTHAEYCPISEEEEECGKRQVLVLGLDGAGKSSMLRSLTSGDSVARTGRCRPTRGFNFISLNVSAFQLDFLEVGGGEDLRRYWLDYLRKTHILLFVVDSSDRPRLPLAKAELHRLLREEPQLPVVVLGNKQDKANAVSGSELHEALALHTVTADRKLFLLTSQLDSGAVRTSIQNLLLQLL